MFGTNKAERPLSGTDLSAPFAQNTCHSQVFDAGDIIRILCCLAVGYKYPPAPSLKRFPMCFNNTITASSHSKDFLLQSSHRHVLKTPFRHPHYLQKRFQGPHRRRPRPILRSVPSSMSNSSHTAIKRPPPLPADVPHVHEATYTGSRVE